VNDFPVPKGALSPGGQLLGDDPQRRGSFRLGLWESSHDSVISTDSRAGHRVVGHPVEGRAALADSRCLHSRGVSCIALTGLHGDAGDGCGAHQITAEGAVIKQGACLPPRLSMLPCSIDSRLDTLWPTDFFDALRRSVP